jgi:hypothetical protein
VDTKRNSTDSFKWTVNYKADANPEGTYQVEAISYNISSNYSHPKWKNIFEYEKENC